MLLPTIWKNLTENFGIPRLFEIYDFSLIFHSTRTINLDSHYDTSHMMKDWNAIRESVYVYTRCV